MSGKHPDVSAQQAPRPIRGPVWHHQACQRFFFFFLIHVSNTCRCQLTEGDGRREGGSDGSLISKNTGLWIQSLDYTYSFLNQRDVFLSTHNEDIERKAMIMLNNGRWRRQRSLMSPLMEAQEELWRYQSVKTRIARFVHAITCPPCHLHKRAGYNQGVKRGRAICRLPNSRASSSLIIPSADFLPSSLVFSPLLLLPHQSGITAPRTQLVEDQHRRLTLMENWN